MIKKEILNDNTDITANSKQLEILKRHFPSCFDKNGAFIPHKMAEIVGENGLDLSRESYSLNWLGKSYTRLLTNLNPQTLLKEDKAHNTKPEHQNSRNLLIKGDNLEVLKHLKNAYGKDGGQVKMIYIDPPYNTGSDGFVYNDDRKFTPEQLSRLSGIELDEAKRILEFTASKSNSHSAWLTFMYPRLYVAHSLLREDGVIFISIDDNEAAQLKLLCDEVFGEENLLGQIIIQTATDNNKTQINTEHEYILAYARNKTKQVNWFRTSEAAELMQSKYLDLKAKYNSSEEIQTELRKWIKANKEYLKKSKILHYDNVDDKGVYHDGDIANTKFGGYSYYIEHPITKQGCKIPEKGFRFPESTLLQMIADGDILFGSDETTLMKPKKRLESVKDTLRSIIYEDGRTSSNIVDDLIGRGVFQNPKSHFVLSRLIDFTTNKQDIVLDFFAGSGTTAHAVMALNAEDAGNRRFITVQIDEPTDFKSEAFKAEYKSIFDITKARIEKAAAKIKSEKPDLTCDLGFRVFETIPLFKGADEEIEELSDKLELYDGSKLSGEELDYLLLTWKTYDGIELTEDLKPIEFAGYMGYTYGKTVYFMDKGFSDEALEAFIKTLDEEPSFQPSKLVLYGYNFQSKFQRQISEGLKNYTNKKSIELDVVVRY